MGDRFYQEQLRLTGDCPGNNKRKRRRKVAWSDEKREQAVQMYQEADPTSENSMEVVKEIAEELEETPNGVRMVLSKAGVYIKKVANTNEPKAAGSGGGTRVSKEDAQAGLIAAIKDAGQVVDEDIISKLTGKAAVYLKGVIEAINN